MRIAVVATHPVQHFCPQYSSWSEHQGWNVKVIFGSPAGFERSFDEGFGRDIKWRGLNLDFAHVFLKEDNSDTLGVPRGESSLAQALNDFRPHVVIIYGYRPRVSREALLWCRRTRTPSLMIADSELRHWRPLLVKVCKAPYLRHLFRKVAGFLTVGDANEEYYRRYGVEVNRLFRSGLPIDLPRYQAALQHYRAIRERTRMRHSVGAEDVVVGVVGKLIDRKRQGDLVTAVLRCWDRCARSVRLWVIGSGPNADALRDRARRAGNRQAEMVGFIEPEELPEYYAGMDIYVQPSEMDPHSLAVSEAAYMRNALIVSDATGSYGPSDDVRIGRTGLVYPVGDIGRLSQQLCWLATRRPLLTSMGMEAARVAADVQALAHGKGLEGALRVLRADGRISGSRLDEVATTER